MSAVFVSNELVIPAPHEAVWAWLIRASSWPEWYSNSANVRLPNPAVNLEAGMQFEWKTFGVSLRSEVLEFEPRTRLAWNALSAGVDAYHAWLLEEVAGGTRVLTEETQHGFLARLGKLFMPNRMYKYHQIWLGSLSVKAQSGMPED